MLVLSRKERERIIIDPDSPDAIEILVTEIGGGRVKLGFKAPRGRVIVRSEVRPEVATAPLSQQTRAAVDRRQPRMQEASRS